MKKLHVIIAFLCIGFLHFTACKSELSPSKSKNHPKITRPEKGLLKKAPSGDLNYMTAMIQEVGLNDQQAQTIQQLNKKYSELIQKTPKINGKPDRNKNLALQAQKKKEIRKILGDELTDKKEAFDAEWLKKTGKPQGRKLGPNKNKGKALQKKNQ